MRKPLIGLTANRADARSPLSVNAAYSDAVLAACLLYTSVFDLYSIIALLKDYILIFLTGLVKLW